MSFDKRFYGLYEGIVVNHDDPEKRGRVKLRVPQVTGFEETNWAPAMSGSPILYQYPYGSFQDMTTQTQASASTAAPILLNTVDYAYGIELVNGSKLRVNNYGTYNLQWSGQFENTLTASDDVTVWIRVNGVDVPGSAGYVNVPPKHGQIPGKIIAAWNYVLDLEPGDEVQFYWQVDVATVSLKYYPAATNPVRPAAASMIVTLHVIGNYRPNEGARVGVMYLAGDPNFPVWTGEIS